MAVSEGRVISKEAKDVEYDNNNNEGIAGDGAENLMIQKRLMTTKEDDSYNSLIFNEHWNNECDKS